MANEYETLYPSVFNHKRFEKKKAMNELPVFKFALRADLLEDKRFLPSKAEPFATGYDVKAAQQDRKNIILRSGEYSKIPLGFRAFCPPGWWYKLVPRSSSFAKKGLHALYGTIDETYENELVFACQYIPDVKSLNPDLIIKFGDAIGQIIPVQRIEMEVKEVSNEDYDKLCVSRGALRGAGGFGSTDITGFYKTGNDK